MVTLILAMLLGATPESTTAQPLARPVKICREGRPETGTHMRVGRTCKTAEEWAEDDAKRQKYLPLSAQIHNNEEDIAKGAIRPK